MFIQKSIAAKIGVYVVALVMVISVGYGVLSYHYGSSAVITEVEQALVSEAVQAAGYIESNIANQLATLEVLAGRPEIMSTRYALYRTVLRSEVERLDGYLALGVVDSSGVARYHDGTTAELGDLDYVQQAFDGISSVSDLLISEETNSPVLMYAVPIIQYDEVVGALIGKSDGAALSELTDQLGFGETGRAYILGADGTFYAHRDREYVQERANIFTDTEEFGEAGAAIQALGMGNTGIVRYALQGIPSLVGLAPLESTGWMIGVGAIEADVLVNVNILRNMMFVLGAIFILLGLLSAFVIGRNIARPLRQVEEAIKALADGDLTRTVEVKSKDEVGRVSAAINKTISTMRQAMSLVSSTTNDLAAASQQMAASSEEVSASIEEVASTTNEFSSTVESMNNNTQEMSETMNDVSKRAAEGGSAIKGIIDDMSALRDNTTKLAKEVESLGELSGDVGKIVGVITEIAEQTNLLALNAAIEAARAGEHGRGFAVVAEEVRKLAEQSSQATNEITSLIGRMQSGVSTAVSGMNEGATQAANTLTSVSDSGQLLNGILEAITGIVDQVDTISAGIDQVSKGGHEIAGATQEQAASMEQVASSAQNLTNMSTKLKELVERFRLEN